MGHDQNPQWASRDSPDAAVTDGKGGAEADGRQGGNTAWSPVGAPQAAVSSTRGEDALAHINAELAAENQRLKGLLAEALAKEVKWEELREAVSHIHEES